MKITIETIPHKEQRYDTVGDWQYNGVTGEVFIRVSELGNWRYEALIAVHELCEFLLCTDKSVDMEAVDNFDINFRGDTEPGDHPRAPYRDQHCFATAVERMLCAAMGLSWSEYDEAVGTL